MLNAVVDQLLDIHTSVTVSGRPRRPLASLLLKNLQSDSNVSPRDGAFFSSIT